MISIDPGEVHCGVVIWNQGGVDEVFDWTPGQLTSFLEQTAQQIWVCEEFRLYLWEAKNLSFKVMTTSEVIGVIKYLARTRDKHLVMQDATVKTPAFAIARARGIEAPAGSVHVRDAWAHGIFHQYAGGSA